MIRTVSKYIREYKLSSILTILFAIGEVGFEIFIPFTISRLIDDGVSIGNLNNVIKYGIFMLILSILGLTCGIMAGVFGAKSSSGFAANLRLGMFENIQTFSFSNIDKFSTAGLVTRLTTDITNIQNAYQLILRLMMRAPATLIFSIIMTVAISRSLSLIFIIAVIFLGLIVIFITRIALNKFTKTFEKYDELNAGVQENIKGIRVVKSFVQEDYEINKFNKSVDNLFNLFKSAELSVVIMNPAMLFTVYMCMIALSWFGAKQILAGSLTTGQLTSLFSYVTSIMMSLMMLAYVFVMITISMASAKRVAEILDEKADIKNPANPIKSVKDGSISFTDVCFSYKKNSQKYILSDINLDIKSGETIGIIGGTGSSKTSLINLISRLYDVNKGSVKVGGIDVREYDLEELRNKVAVVLQKNELFTGTILENLRWGNENATLEECKKACELACADEFINRFPNGYETHIEQGGSNVSGGQKQRLCIARALLKNPKIIIFDDSTSAVDTATDAKIREALRTGLPNTTKIIIAQRISSIQDADRIVILDEGKINAIDTHENLLQNNEIYQMIASIQLEGSKDFDKKEEA